ncbi:MAG TPA: DNA-3-methyladenine glycosylase [Candidatus Saccharimonadales bacterium]|jgi:DNA-3-methyladenine glycosylase|nr:DNA-3-methyladenine glycosylase [Candidatus Saccharimonadales bacterium]
MKYDPFDFLEQAAEEVAPRLLGCYLEHEIDGYKLVGKILETEAYDQTDAASHSYRGQTPRTEVMFGPAGRLYVYFTYGMHYCCNVVCGPVGHGSAVLVRAVEPLAGQDVMRQNRHGLADHQLTNGPAKFCQAFGIDKRWNGHDLHQEPFRLIVQPKLRQTDVVQTTRVGISQAKDVPWRFYVRGNPYVSKPVVG